MAGFLLTSSKREMSLFVHSYNNIPQTPMNILVIDNQDSFVYNLVHYLEAFGHEITVKRPTSVSEIDINLFDKVVLSPGPGLPHESGELLKAIELWHKSIPILGVCLGHQALALFFGGHLKNLEQVAHGISTPIHISDKPHEIFKGLPDKIDVARYHSWSILAERLPPELECTAVDENQEIMAIRHKIYPIHGIQFHPESILTPHGRKIVQNWLES